MQSRIEERHMNLMDDITLQLQKEKVEKILEGHQKKLQKVELQLEDVHVKYDVAKAKIIKDQAQRIEDVIIYENKIDDMGVQNEGKLSNVKQYCHHQY